MRVSADMIDRHFRLPIPAWNGDYSRFGVDSHWIDILASRGVRLDPYIAELAKRSIESRGSTHWKADHSLAQCAALLERSILTGVWTTIVAADKSVTAHQLRKLVVTSLYALAKQLGTHFRAVVLASPNPVGRAHIHVVIEISWVIRDHVGEANIHEVLIPHLPDGNVHLAPFVIGGGALQYQLDHTHGPKRPANGDIVFEPRVICSGTCTGSRNRGQDACAFPWDSQVYSDGSRYDRSRLPAVRLGEVVSGHWIRDLPRRHDHARVARVRASRERPIAILKAINEFQADGGLPPIPLPQTAEAIIAKRRQEMRREQAKVKRLAAATRNDEQLWGGVVASPPGEPAPGAQTVASGTATRNTRARARISH